jgi:MinD-like ATPase involved in chromosome partitioning or flagellar assembly/DNA-binding response OmpR family regulator
MRVNGLHQGGVSVGAISNLIGRPMAVVALEDDVELQRELERTIDRVPDDLTLVSYTSQESEIVRLARDNAVDLVLVDESLPRRPWTTVVEALRSGCPEARVVLMTERPSKGLLDEALDHGARHIVRKGLDPAALVASIKDVLDDERRQRLRVQQLGVAGESDPDGYRALTPISTGPVQGQVIALGSGIAGGTGKTTAAVNMAVWLATNPFRRCSVAMCDLEKDVGSISSFFPGTPPQPSILEWSDYAGSPAIPPEVLSAKVRRDTDAFRKYHLSLVFGACDLEREQQVTEDLVRTVLVSLRLHHQFVIVDLPADLTDGAIGAIEQASKVLWLIRDYQADLTRTSRAFQKLRQLGIDVSRIQAVISRVDPSGRMQFSPRQVRETLGTVLMPYAIPEETRLRAWARAYRFAAMVDQAGPYMASLRHILEEVQPGTGYPPQAAEAGGAGRRWPFRRRTREAT